VLSSDRNTESKASKRGRLTWRHLLEFPCAMETKSSTYISFAATGPVALSATGTSAASGRVTSLDGALHGVGVAGSGGAGVSNTSSSGWALKSTRALIMVVARSHIFSVAAQNYDGEFTQSIGRAKGNQLKGSLPSFVSSTTPSLGMSAGSSHTR
jgi:hypothetical protein